MGNWKSCSSGRIFSTLFPMRFSQIPKILLLCAVANGVAEAAPPAAPSVHAQMPAGVSDAIKMQIALSLDTPSCAGGSVRDLPAGTYYGKEFVIAYPSAAEAADSASWSYELQVMSRLLELVDGKDSDSGVSMDDPAYKSIDTKSPDRFIDPGVTFVFSGEEVAGARKASVNGRSVWLADDLPASCFSTTKPAHFQEGDFVKICFVPLTSTGTAGSK